MGDITATYEVSDLDTSTQTYRESIQGGLTADGLNSILAGLFTSMPNTTFAQNNGVISLVSLAYMCKTYGFCCRRHWLISRCGCRPNAQLVEQDGHVAFG